MLTFVVPLKSKQLSTSWSSISKLFERSVKSICNQTSPEFQVIVVCHEKPEIEFDHPRLTYIEVEFPVPAPDLKSKNLDRERKVLQGITKAQQLNASHIMIVDADDCISKHIAEFVQNNAQSDGWFMTQGYIYENGSRFIRLQKEGFNHYCGTCNIIKSKWYYFPENISEDELVNYIYDYYRHVPIVDTLAKEGAVLQPFSFVGSIYIQHGENNRSVKGKKKHISLKSRLSRTKSMLDNRLLTQAIRDEFGLYQIQ
jgi:hypothetical protein